MLPEMPSLLTLLFAASLLATEIASLSLGQFIVTQLMHAAEELCEHR